MSVWFWPLTAAWSKNDGVGGAGKGANAEDDEKPNRLAEVPKSAARVVSLPLLLFGKRDMRDIFTPCFCTQRVGHIAC